MDLFSTDFMSKFSCGSEKLRGVSWGWSLRDKETAGYRWEDGSAGLAPTKGFARTPSLLAEGRTPKGCCRKIKEIAQCLRTASEAAEAQQQDKDAPACGELQQNHSQFRWGISPHPLEQPWKKKNKKQKRRKTHGTEHSTVVNMSTRVLVCKRSFAAPLLEGEMEDCSLCAIFAPWAPAVRAPGLLQPRETFCSCIHNLGTIRNTNWPSDPLLIYSTFHVKHLIPLLWLLAPNITSYMGLVSSKYHHV